MFGVELWIGLVPSAYISFMHTLVVKKISLSVYCLLYAVSTHTMHPRELYNNLHAADISSIVYRQPDNIARSLLASHIQETRSRTAIYVSPTPPRMHGCSLQYKISFLSALMQDKISVTSKTELP